MNQINDTVNIIEFNKFFPIDFILRSLEEIDESLAKNDVNAVTKKVHECIAAIKCLRDSIQQNDSIYDILKAAVE